MWQLSPASRTWEAVDDCLVSVPWWRAHTIVAHAVLVLFPHFRRYTQRLRTCHRSLSLSQTGRAVRGGCALLLPDGQRINMTSGERVLWFIWNRRLDGEGSLCWDGEDWAVSLVRHCDPTLETPTVTYRYFRREGQPIPPYWWSRRDPQRISWEVATVINGCVGLTRSKLKLNPSKT